MYESVVRTARYFCDIKRFFIWDIKFGDLQLLEITNDNPHNDHVSKMKSAYCEGCGDKWNRVGKFPLSASPTPSWSSLQGGPLSRNFNAFLVFSLNERFYKQSCSWIHSKDKNVNDLKEKYYIYYNEIRFGNLGFCVRLWLYFIMIIFHNNRVAYLRNCVNCSLLCFVVFMWIPIISRTLGLLHWHWDVIRSKDVVFPV